MLHTSLRVIHQSDRFTVTKYTATIGHTKWHAVVIERLDNGTTIGVQALNGQDADDFLTRWHNAIGESVNTRPVAKPFGVEDVFIEYFIL